jgi:membrane associated rhomboid family serine protease
MKQRFPGKGRQVGEGIALLLAVTAFMWAIEGVASIAGQQSADRWGGIHPRDIGDLWSIFTSWFLHANFSPHLIDNTIPFLFMGVFIALQGAKRFASVLAIVIIVGGLGTWLIGPSGTYTVGASGVVFGFATYLFARGLFDRNALELVVGVIVGFVWGAALVDSVVPHQGVSWQAHVCGAIGGVVAAYVLATRSRKQAGVSAGGSGVAASGSASSSAASASAASDPLQAHQDALDRALGSR